MSEKEKSKIGLSLDTGYREIFSFEFRLRPLVRSRDPVGYVQALGLAQHCAEEGCHWTLVHERLTTAATVEKQLPRPAQVSVISSTEKSVKAIVHSVVLDLEKAVI